VLVIISNSSVIPTPLAATYGIIFNKRRVLM